MNITFITRSGISTLIRMSNTTKTAMLPKMAFAYFIRRSQLIMLHNRRSVPDKSCRLNGSMPYPLVSDFSPGRLV